MQCDYALAHAYVSALTQQNADTSTIDLRFLHDRDHGRAGIKRRGTLAQLWQELCDYNSAGYGVFINIADMDGSGTHEIANVSAVRCQAVDLDNLDAPQQLERAAAWHPAPAFWVCSSPNKYHVYWHTPYHRDIEAFTLTQRKLIEQFGGDRRIHDPSRVLRLPGTYHHKGEPHLITCGALAGYGVIHQLGTFDAALAHIDVTKATGVRHELGDPNLSAPDIEWLEMAMREIDPNKLERGEWVSIMAGFKQAGWLHATEDYLLDFFMKWCARYDGDNPAENLKNWKSLRTTEVGWQHVLRRAPGTNGKLTWGGSTAAHQLVQASLTNGTEPASAPPMPGAQPQLPKPSELGEMLTAEECREYFNDCTYVAELNEIIGPRRAFYGSSQFNTNFGGKRFIIDQLGKTTEEAWKAATCSMLWTIPKVHHTRFLPHMPYGEIITDELGRTGVNTYLPAQIKRREGNPQRFLDHVARILPVQSDRDILFSFMAHCVKFPGYKIPWAPLIQSTEGAGKGVFKAVMAHAIGSIYCHYPNAAQMADSGNKFNGWVRNKLFILCDEIRVDEKRDMVEALKPLISEATIEVQSKGVDQKNDDNFANWMFFSNYKDAIPVSKNGRRWAVFYSALQTHADLMRLGMDQRYFDDLFAWLEAGGFEIVNDWLFRYPIERGAIPMRAPDTSSTGEAIQATRSPLEQIIAEAIDDGAAGFRGGYISVPAVITRAKASGMRQPSARVVAGILEGMGYVYLGKVQGGAAAFEQNPNVYALRADMPLSGYVAQQGVIIPPMAARH